MAADGEVKVRPAALVQHASSVDSLADGVVVAQHAGESTILGGHAYGQLCAFLPPLLAGIQNNLVDGIATAAESLRDTAARVRQVSSGYTATDDRNAAGYESLMAPR